MDRIESLREAALNRTFSASEFFYLFYKHYEGSPDSSEYARYTDAFYRAFSALTPNISEGELIVGRIEDRMSDDQRAEWVGKYKEIAAARSDKAGGGQDSHMAVDYELILSEGLLGIMDRIDRLMENCDGDRAEFYSAAKGCLAAVIAHSESYARAAESLAAGEPNAERRRELCEIAAICRAVPANPANSFYEAVQSVHFVTYCLSLNPFRSWSGQQFQLGHPDRYLYPYYKRDVEGGLLTNERAQLLLDCLGVQINERVPLGLSSGYMVGGRDRSGKTVANELTHMLMQVIDDVRLVYPAVGLCYTEDMPAEYLTAACGLLLKGRSHPAIFNDDVISKGLRYYGVPEADSHDYIHSTCVEITPTAASNVWVASPYTNMMQLLLDTMVREYDSFDDHLGALLDALDRRIENKFNSENQSRRTRAENSVNPLLSCFVNDCLERGLDIERGGARYNWIMPSYVGLANLVDSLYALKKVVYDEKRLTVSEFKVILDQNFEGNEPLRLHLLDALPKYGNDNDEIDGYFGMLTEHIIAECAKYTALHSNGKLIPSVFCWEMHERFGRSTGATPDGRRAGFPLGDGSGPCQGRELNGPTASILSSTKWDHHRLIGGVAVNMKFTKSKQSNSSSDVMKALIVSFMKRGGFEMQINVTDKSILERARKSPEEYRDLVVRVGGYSDYFTRLSPEMQAEIILRTEHEI